MPDLTIPAQKPNTVAGVTFDCANFSIQVTSVVTPDGVKSTGRLICGRHHNAANGQSLADPTAPVIVTEPDLFNCSTPARQQCMATILAAIATLNATEKLV